MPLKLVYKKLSRSDWFVFLVIIGALALSFVALDSGAQSDGLLHVYFLDVGQGDSILIDFNGRQILIDGGPDSSVLRELGRILSFNDRFIDMVVLTHPDADHINGLIEILERYKVGSVLENPIKKHDAPAYQRWNELKIKTTTTQAERGQVIDLGNGAYLEVLYPIGGSVSQSKTNNNSIVTRLVYGQSELLLTGDIEAKVEHELIGRGINIDADFLKMPHHGSKTSATAEFLDSVTPEAAFIQLGKDNRYGHPHPLVLERLENRDIRYYRTDSNGTIELILDGQNYKVVLGK